MTSPLRHEARIRGLESRVGEIEGSYGATLYELRRESVRTTITLGRIAEALSVTVASDADVDAALDEEA